MSSAVEFVEGGVQEACEDACSICLEAFSDQDPASVTKCNHEYHLQCIIEWSQRSTDCPMCWQPLTLQDASSQELLASMEQERSLRQNRFRASLLPRLRSGDYEFHQLPESFEERILQHFAAAVGQTHGLGRGGRSQSRPPVAGHRPSQFVIFPPYSPAASSGSAGHDESASAKSIPNALIFNGQDEAGISYVQQSNASTGAASVPRHGDANVQSHSARQRVSESASASHYGASTSDFQSFSETFKSRLAAVSSRYKESLTKTTRIFRERLRARNGVAPDTNAGEGGLSIMQNMRGISSGNSEHREDTGEPPSNLIARQAVVSDETSTDINTVHIADDENNQEDVSFKDEGSTNTSSQATSHEAAEHYQDVTVRVSNEVTEPLNEEKPTVSIT